MITELAILSPFLLGWYYKWIPWYVPPAFLATYYWLPKPIVLNMLLDRFFPQILSRVKTDKGQIALTFDDLPYGSHKEIIDLLNRNNMKGTFFMISGYLTPDNEELFVDAVKQGHQLANHGQTNSMHALKSKEELHKEVNHCHDAIVRIYEKAGVPLPAHMFYRPGCGLFNKAILALSEQEKFKGYQVALGSVYPNDPIVASSSINYWYLTQHIEKGDVVILHDRKWTPGMLEKLLPWLTDKKGLTSVTLNELVM